MEMAKVFFDKDSRPISSYALWFTARIYSKNSLSLKIPNSILSGLPIKASLSSNKFRNSHDVSGNKRH
jgi:hypothetical protein